MKNLVNNSMYETLDNEYRHNVKKIENSSMMEDVDGNNDDNEPGENVKIMELQKENLELKRIIAELKNNTVCEKDNFLDVFTYVFTGIVLILLLENLTKAFNKLIM